MKKQYGFCRTALLLCAWLFSSAVWAYDFEADGIYYNITSSGYKTVEVTGTPDHNYSGDVTIPATVTTNEGIEYRVIAIGYDAFYMCNNLKSVTIPEGVTTIGGYAFEGCSGLTSVTIPESVTAIGDLAFAHCDGLTSVTIPESVQTIGDWAFDCCFKLTSVTAYNPIPVDIVVTYVWGSLLAFDGVDCANCKLYVPKGSVEAYRNAEGWSKFGEILPIDESSAITETQQDKADGHVTVYNLQGVLVLETDDAADLRKLSAGFYIVNGKKMIIAQ